MAIDSTPGGGSFIIRALDKVERVGNKLPDPATLFIIFTLLVMAISAICGYFNVSVTYSMINAAQGEIVTKNATVVNLLSADSLRYLVTTIISNFTGFFALGTVFTIILGVGVADGSGFMSALFRKIAASTPKSMISMVVVFLGIMSNVASSTGYVVLVPLGAVLFMAFDRHPIAGLAAAFAGVSGGWNANLLIGSNDPLFAGMSTQAANMIDASYVVTPVANWYFMVVSTFMLTIIGALITDKLIEPRLPVYKKEKEESVSDIELNEKRGMRFAGASALAYLAIMLFLILPENALLRNQQTGGILVSPFMSGIIFFMMLLFMIPGLFYGIGAGTIKSDKDVVGMMNRAIGGLASFMVLIFFAAQFNAFFTYSNLGIVLSVTGANFLQKIGFIGLPLIICFIMLTAFINLFIAVDSAKWAMMAPIFVPMFMRLGLSPELTQVAYRIGDSCTNIIAPLMPFFVLTVAFFQKYDKKAGIGTVISTMLPYSVAFLVSWTLLFTVWYLLKLPIGPGSPLFYGAAF